MFSPRICYFSVNFAKCSNVPIIFYCRNGDCYWYDMTVIDWYVIIIVFHIRKMQPKLNAEHKNLAERIPILGWFNYWKYATACTGKVHTHLIGSGCRQMIFLPRAALLVFYKMYQSINQLYLSTVVIKAEKLMGPSQKKEKYKTTRIIIVQQLFFSHTKILQVINNLLVFTLQIIIILLYSLSALRSLNSILFGSKCIWIGLILMKNLCTVSDTYRKCVILSTKKWIWHVLSTNDQCLNALINPWLLLVNIIILHFC